MGTAPGGLGGSGADATGGTGVPEVGTGFGGNLSGGSLMGAPAGGVG